MPHFLRPTETAISGLKLSLSAANITHRVRKTRYGFRVVFQDGAMDAVASILNGLRFRSANGQPFTAFAFNTSTEVFVNLMEP